MSLGRPGRTYRAARRANMPRDELLLALGRISARVSKRPVITQDEIFIHCTQVPDKQMDLEKEMLSKLRPKCPLSTLCSEQTPMTDTSGTGDHAAMRIDDGEAVISGHAAPPHIEDGEAVISGYAAPPHMPSPTLDCYTTRTLDVYVHQSARRQGVPGLRHELIRQWRVHNGN